MRTWKNRESRWKSDAGQCGTCMAELPRVAGPGGCGGRRALEVRGARPRAHGARGEATCDFGRHGSAAEEAALLGRRARGRVEHRRRCSHGPAARALPSGGGGVRADAHGRVRVRAARRRPARGCGPGERAGGARGALVRAALRDGAGGPARDSARWRRAGLAHAAGRHAEGGGRTWHDDVCGRPCVWLRPGASRQEGVGRAACGDGAVCGGVGCAGRGAGDAGRPGAG